MGVGRRQDTGSRALCSACLRVQMVKKTGHRINPGFWDVCMSTSQRKARHVSWFLDSV